MFESLPASSSPYITVFNILLILAVGGLWLMWARNAKRQKNVETLLGTASAQLEEASRHLETALLEIKQLRQSTSRPAQQEVPGESADRPVSPTATPERSGAGDTAKPAGTTANNISTSSAPAKAGGSDVQQILHLHRLGKQTEDIASQLNVPLARVKLLLRINEQRPA